MNETALLAIVFATSWAFHSISADADPLSQLAVAKAQYEELLEDVTAEERKFEERYTAELTKLGEKAKTEGNLELVLAVAEEIRAFKSRLHLLEPSPQTDLARMQQIYHTHSNEISERSATKLLGLMDGYIKHLMAVRDAMTRRGEIDAALEVQTELTRVEEVARRSKERQRWAEMGIQGVLGRYVRISLEGGGRRILHLREVEVMSGGKNVALEGKASQSSTDWGGPPHLANDGRHDSNGDGAVSHTAHTENPWWEVDLGDEVGIANVIIYNRNNNSENIHRLDGFTLTILDGKRETTWKKSFAEAPADSISVDMTVEDPE